MMKNYSKQSRYVICKKMTWIATFIIFLFSYEGLKAQTTNFNYTGSTQSYTIPSGVTNIKIECWGAEGGSGIGFDGIEGKGGLGGYMSGDVTVTPGEVLTIFVGGAGSATGQGGFNGGGQAGTQYGAAGGGASDVRNGSYSLSDRMIVAGGGGGGAYGSYGNIGGDGGGLTGEPGETDDGYTGGGGGTQSAGGSAGCCYGAPSAGTFGFGGGPGDYHNAGGGGGWYGGGSGSGHAGAGGGSSYISNSFTNTITTSGVNSGNGKVVITVLCTEINISPVNTSVCKGSTITLNATSSNGGIITWDNGVTNNTPFTINSTTIFTATSSNPDDCSQSITITANTAPIISSSTTNVSCNAGNDGSATASATGGIAPYTFLWSNAATTASIVNVTAGTYSVTVTDANGCTDTASTTITEPATLVAASVVDSNVNCNGGSEGAATASATGGTAPYTYLWSNGATTASITGVGAGTYSVDITDDNGCTANTSATITEPTVLLGSTTVDANVSCNDGSDGAATASATGGTAPYTYLWSNGASTASMTGLVAGTYTVVVTDNNGCTANASATVTEPTSLLASTTVDANVSCNGGSDGGATVSATGGTAPYTYLWSNDATTASMTGLVAGTYTVVVTDNNGCTANTSATVTEPTTLVASTTVDANVSCNGGSDGAATASATGGTPPYTYLWSNNATTASIVGIVAGTYDVTITDSNGCTTAASATVTEPTALVASTVSTDVSCNGGADGTIDLTVSGGTAPYSYEWDNSATTEDLTALLAGTYDVTVTDANGCTATESVNVTEPIALSASEIATDVSCNGGEDGTVDLTVTGGTAPYSYTWDNSATTEDLTGLMAGTYDVIVTDANGCIATASATVNEPTAISISTLTTDLICDGSSDGAIDVTISGGTTPYSFLWSNTAITEDISGLSEGTYSVTITDANGCTVTESVTLTVVDDEAPIAICQDITITLDDTGNASIFAEDVDNGSTDNCAITSYSIDIDNFDCTMLGLNTVTLTVIDSNGNTSTCSSIVTVEDTELPTLSCQAITINLDENGNAIIVPEDILIDSNDNCGIDSISLDIDTFGCEDVGMDIEITVFAQDGSGNIASCTTTVTVNDVIAPVITCMDEIDVVGNIGNNYYVVPDFIADGDVSAIDNCDGAILNISQSPPAGTLLQEGEHNITFITEDQYGNTSVCITTLNIEIDLKVSNIDSSLKSISLYPNPADNFVRIENPQHIQLEEMTVYNLNGKKVMTLNLESYVDNNVINVSKLQAAQYFVIIKSINNGVIVKQLIKE